MTKIAFLGLGAMGTPLAHRLLTAGHDLTVWNRTASRAEPLVAAGAHAAPTPADAVRDAEIVITMLSDPAAEEAVLRAAADALRPDTLLIEMSTVGPAAIARNRALIPPSVAIVDAPVMGSVDKAAAGELTVLAGGDVERAEPVLALFGTVVPCGDLGSGSARKVVLITGMIAGVALVGEILALADHLGVPDPQAVLAASPLAGLADRAFATTTDFSIAMATKDLGLAEDVLDLPIMAAARQALLAAPDHDADVAAGAAFLRRDAKPA
jgi:3-hydroxyisobutyrate dehydrogenase